MSASFIVIPHALLMSLLNVKFTPFPSLLSSPSASSSSVSTSIPGQTRSWCQSPDAPARGSLAAWSIPLQAQVMSPPITRSGAQSDRHHRQQPRFPVLRRRRHDFRQCKRYAEFRSIQQQPQSRSKQSFVLVRSY